MRKQVFWIWIFLIIRNLSASYQPHHLRIILVEFQDVRVNSYFDSTQKRWVDYSHMYDTQYIRDFFHGDDYPGVLGFGSVTQFFLKMSAGAYEIQSAQLLNPMDSLGEALWLRMPQSKAYYFKKFGYSKTRALMKAEAKLQYGLTDADFRQDDHLMIFLYAGAVKQGGLWQHASGIGRRNYKPKEIMFGFRQRYRKKEPGESAHLTIAPIRDCCHEIGHIMGFSHPNSRYGHAPANHYCLMGCGKTQCNPFILLQLGWADYTVIDRDISNAALIYNPRPGHRKFYYLKQLGKFTYLFEMQSGHPHDGPLPHNSRYLSPPHMADDRKGRGGLLIWRTRARLKSAIKPDHRTDAHIIQADMEFENHGATVEQVARSYQSMAFDFFRPTDHYISPYPPEVDLKVDYTTISDYSQPFNFAQNRKGPTRFAIKNFRENGDTIHVDFINNYWEGGIKKSEVWLREKSPFVLGCDLWIDSSAVLWIEPGVVVDSTTYGQFRIYGTRGVVVTDSILTRKAYKNRILLHGDKYIPGKSHIQFKSNSRIDLGGNLVVDGILYVEPDVVIRRNGYKIQKGKNGEIYRHESAIVQ